MIFAEVESAILEGWGGVLRGRFHTLDSGVGLGYAGARLCEGCVQMYGGLEVAVRWKIDKRDGLNSGRENDFFSFQASKRAVRLHHLLPAW